MGRVALSLKVPGQMVSWQWHDAHGSLGTTCHTVWWELCVGWYVGISHPHTTRVGQWATWAVVMEVCWYWWNGWSITWQVHFYKKKILSPSLASWPPFLSENRDRHQLVRLEFLYWYILTDQLAKTSFSATCENRLLLNGHLNYIITEYKQRTQASVTATSTRP